MPIHKKDRLKRPTRSKYFSATVRKLEDKQSTGDDDIPGNSEECDGEGFEGTGNNGNQSSRKRPTGILSRTELTAKKKAKAIPDMEQLCVESIEYRNDTIHPDTMTFLKELAKNNNRTWFAENDGLYRRAKHDFESLVEALTQRIIQDVDTTVPELPLKDLIFRIYRDIRFSNDQTPYKIYFSAAWSRTGRKGPYAHYYIQIQPHGKSMIGGGIWHADSQPLSLLRRAISTKPSEFKQILCSPGIAKDFLGLRNDFNEHQAINAFIEKNSEDALKTAPKGFSKDHPQISLLRLRSFTVGKPLPDKLVLNQDLFEQSVDLLSKLEPLITYLNSVVMPDFDITDSEESDNNDT